MLLDISLFVSLIFNFSTSVNTNISVESDSLSIAVNDMTGVKQCLQDTIPESFMEKLDYYYKDWYLNNPGKENMNYGSQNSSEVNLCSDSVYLARLDSLYSAVPVSFNDIVKNYIELYIVKEEIFCPK